MKKILLLLAMFLSFATQAQDFTPTNWVTDLGNFYTPEQEATLNKTISDYEKKTSIEIGVVTIESLGDNSIEEFALDQFKRIGVGKKGADNGILIVFSMKDRKSRIEVGNGMEAFLTDSDTYDALEAIKPYFRAGDYTAGTSECINYITNKLGNEAFANKVAWLKEKQAKEAKEQAASVAAFKDGAINVVLVLAFFGTLVFIYYWDKKRREKIAAEKERIRLATEVESKRIRLEAERVEKVKQSIITNENYLKSVKVSQPTILSNLLNSSFQAVSNYIHIKRIWELKQNELTNDQYNNVLLDIKKTLGNKISAYNELTSEVRSNVINFSNLDTLVKDACSSNTSALNALTKIKTYGYNFDYKDLTTSIDNLLPNKVVIESLFNSDVDKATDDAKQFKSSIDFLKRKSSDVNSYLNEIEFAKNKVNGSETLFNTTLNNLSRYRKWIKPGEIEAVKKEFDNYKTKTSNSSDFLALILIFVVVMTSLSRLETTLSRRKSDEEETERKRLAAIATIAAAAEAERRRKRREEEDDDRRRRDSYSSSSSSSDSGSSFGGFGGGSSSGGGSSNDW